MMRETLLTVSLGVVVGLPVHAQEWRTVENAEWCERHWGEGERYCEVRETSLPANRERVAVDGGANGGIEVTGWERDEILVRVKVAANADRMTDARALVREVQIFTEGTIRADGPRSGRHEWWSASFEIFLPVRSSLDLETVNGGIAIENVTGRIDFRATNGGVRLSRLAGDVRGQTTNGGLDIDLTGTEWNGEGMAVRTTNGGVTIRVPEGYSAELETGTVNGGLRLDFPVTVQGRIDRRISVTLGSGGKLVRAHTTNGGVVVRRK